MNPEFVEKLSAAVPRYTSYPAALHFASDVGPREFGGAIQALDPNADLSVYVHIPFCKQLCWYCGCSTKVGRGGDTSAAYLDTVEQEVATLRRLFGGKRKVIHVHWGGGTPNYLEPDLIERLTKIVASTFDLSSGAEFAVEIDPRWLTAEQVQAFARAGVNRASIGIQDFDPQVQGAINRQQSFEVTAASVELLRAAGIRDINIDLVYGLPHQTRQSVARTIEKALLLAPSRVALFGYAHLPQRAKHQRAIDEKALPGSAERFGQSRRARRLLLDAGYKAVGLDHFARPDDALVTRPVHRNFQGYTSDAGEALIGIGASAISRMPSGYFQNAIATQDYAVKVASDGLATVRGYLLSRDDIVRGHVIERLMCDFSFSSAELKKRFGSAADVVARVADELIDSDTDGLVEETSDGFRVTEKGQPFVRSIAACFDAYYAPEKGRYSPGV